MGDFILFSEICSACQVNYEDAKTLALASGIRLAPRRGRLYVAKSQANAAHDLLKDYYIYRRGRRGKLRHTARSYIYFIEAGGFIKIGIASDLASRLTAIAVSNPHPVAILHSCVGTTEDEKAFHRRFSGLHYRGEWFRHEGELKAFLAEKTAQSAKESHKAELDELSQAMELIG